MSKDPLDPNDPAKGSGPRLNRLTGDLRDDMVAYLDGECEQDTAQSIDQLLASNPIARQEVDRLAKVYDLLDHLPRPAASTDFTNATMKSVKAIQPVERDVPGAVGSVVKAWIPAAKMFGLSAACMLGGLVVGQQLFTPKSDALLEDAAAIERLEVYRAAATPEFVDWLAKDTVNSRLRRAIDGR